MVRRLQGNVMRLSQKRIVHISPQPQPSHDRLWVDWQSYGFIIAGKRGYLVKISQKA